jgi:hypothetical protein
MPKDNNTAVADTQVAEVAANNTSLSTQSNNSIQIDAEDIDIPRINVIQKMSQIDAPIGSIVVNKTDVVALADQPVEVIVVSAQKGWRQDVPFEEDIVPLIAWTKQRAEEIALDSEYELIEFAEITMLIKQPEDSTNEDAFPFPIGGSNYALGRINVSKNAYRSTYKCLATFAAFNKGVSLSGRIWTLKSSSMSKGKYSWFSPSLTITKNEPNAEVIDFLAGFGG